MNKELNVFKVMTEEQKLKEIKRLEILFPSGYPGYSYKFTKEDIRNLYIGRIISILDEFGETNDWPKYTSISVDKMQQNYDKLLLRFVKEYKPEILSFYIEYYGIEDN